jgi:hypothetical protein
MVLRRRYTFYITVSAANKMSAKRTIRCALDFLHVICVTASRHLQGRTLYLFSVNFSEEDLKKMP